MVKSLISMIKQCFISDLLSRCRLLDNFETPKTAFSIAVQVSHEMDNHLVAY